MVGRGQKQSLFARSQAQPRIERASTGCRKIGRPGWARNRNRPARQSGLHGTGALLETVAGIAGIKAYLFPPAKSLYPVPCAAGIRVGRLDELKSRLCRPASARSWCDDYVLRLGLATDSVATVLP